jgi:hypothetical protein
MRSGAPSKTRSTVTIRCIGVAAVLTCLVAATAGCGGSVNSPQSSPTAGQSGSARASTGAASVTHGFGASDCVKRWNRLGYGAIFSDGSSQIYVKAVDTGVCWYEAPLNQGGGNVYASMTVSAPESANQVASAMQMSVTPSQDYAPNYSVFNGQIKSSGTNAPAQTPAVTIPATPTVPSATANPTPSANMYKGSIAELVTVSNGVADVGSMEFGYGFLSYAANQLPGKVSCHAVAGTPVIQSSSVGLKIVGKTPQSKNALSQPCTHLAEWLPAVLLLSGGAWKTINGLRIGDPESQIKRTHIDAEYRATVALLPGAGTLRNAYVLDTCGSQCPNPNTPTFLALTSNGHVTGFAIQFFG